MRRIRELLRQGRVVEGMAGERALWAALSRLLREGRYRGQALVPVRSARGGKVRVRGLPTVCDRIVQRAFLNECGSRLNPTSAVSFSYQPGRSWLNALGQVQRYRDAGLGWVLRTDIEDFFARIDHELLLAGIGERIGDPEVVELVKSWVRAPWLTPNGPADRSRGLPEGAPVSPALAEFFLTGFDREVDGWSGRLVRYADDITVLCADPDDAVAALADVERALTGLGLQMNTDKTYIAGFDFGFTLLGWRFAGAAVEPAGESGGEGR